jgi:hypothetical protein
MKPVLDSSPPASKRNPIRVPSRIYKRGDIYCFRLVLPEGFKGRFGQEIRHSLMTPYRRRALELSGKLYAEIQELLRDPKIVLI